MSTMNNNRIILVEELLTFLLRRCNYSKQYISFILPTCVEVISNQNPVVQDKLFANASAIKCEISEWDLTYKKMASTILSRKVNESFRNEIHKYFCSRTKTGQGLGLPLTRKKKYFRKK